MTDSELHQFRFNHSETSFAFDAAFPPPRKTINTHQLTENLRLMGILAIDFFTDGWIELDLLTYRPANRNIGMDINEMDDLVDPVENKPR